MPYYPTGACGIAPAASHAHAQHLPHLTSLSLQGQCIVTYLSVYVVLSVSVPPEATLTLKNILPWTFALPCIYTVAV